MKIIDLPDDVLSIVFLYLKPRDFLSFCRSSKLLYDNYQKDSLFWRSLTSSTFRTPISPLLKADGARWYFLYRRLRTQTRLYTWGPGVKGNLGHGVERIRGPGRRVRVGGRFVMQPPRVNFERAASNWPTEARVPDEVGVIADLQCGGWSTVILSAQGSLYATGSINSTNMVNVGLQTDQFQRLEYLTQSTSAISQFSAGRAHILALNDDHEILSWDRINAKGLKVLSHLGSRFAGTPTRVVAGWGDSSAYVPELGIIYWSPLKNDQQDDMLDGREVEERIVPNTARKISRDGTVFEVLAHIVLEGMLVWITSDSKVWACAIERPEGEHNAIQIPGYGDSDDRIQDIQGSFRNFAVFTTSGRVQAGNKDYIERCFRMSRLAGSETYEKKDLSDPSNWGNVEDLLSSRPRDVPALQHTGVISVRFGDWHYHALHSNGKITSHGHEPQSCGALGLGDAHQCGKLRGETTGPINMRQDTNLLPVADLRGRQIWFEPEKRDWLQHLQKYAKDTYNQDRENNQYFNDILEDPIKQTIFSEWIEQEGRHWDDGPLTQNEGRDLSQSTQDLELGASKDFHLDAYFALAIGAAGWHSGALVLVDEEKAEDTRQKWIPHAPPIRHDKPKEENVLVMPLPGSFPKGQEEPKPVWVHDSFPRIRFSDGMESPVSPGLAEGEHTLRDMIRPWRDGMPSMQELGL